MNKPKKFKHTDKKLEDKVNIFINGLHGNCELAQAWWMMMGEFINLVPEKDRKQIKTFIFDVMEDMEEELDLELQKLEKEYFPE